MMKFKVVWCCSKDYVRRDWLFSVGVYPRLTYFVRICGLLLQFYRTPLKSDLDRSN